MVNVKFNEKEIIKKITVRKPISPKELSFDLAGNLLTVAGEDSVDKVNLILTKEYLYLHYKRNALVGNLEKISDIVRLPLENIKEFSVRYNEIKEVIAIKIDEETYYFIRDNHKQDNLSSTMAALIKNNK